MSKDTKGVRQVREAINKFSVAQSFLMERVIANRLDTGKLDDKQVDELDTLIEELEAKLQEIMLGMLPEERELPEQGDFTREGWQKYDRAQAFNEARNLVEQNIRGGFKV